MPLSFFFSTSINMPTIFHVLSLIVRSRPPIFLQLVCHSRNSIEHPESTSKLCLHTESVISYTWYPFYIRWCRFMCIPWTLIGPSWVGNFLLPLGIWLLENRLIARGLFCGQMVADGLRAAGSGGVGVSSGCDFVPRTGDQEPRIITKSALFAI